MYDIDESDMIAQHTNFATRKRVPPTITGWRLRWTMRGNETAMKMAAGIMERNIFSNLMVKSKSPRHPSTAGPSDSSLRQPEKSIVAAPADGDEWRYDTFVW